MSALARTGLLREATRHRAAAAAAPIAPVVAVLCAPGRARTVACAVALALAGTVGRAPAIAGAVVGSAEIGGVGATLRARRGAAHLRARGGHALAHGRLVWIALDAHVTAGPAAAGPGVAATDPAAATADPAADTGDDPVGLAAAAAAAHARAAAALATPAALAVPLPRTDGLDRVLAWHDALVVVREPDASVRLFERALASLAELGRPVVSMAPPSRIAAGLASAGVRAPVEAVQAVAQLGIGDPRRRDG